MMNPLKKLKCGVVKMKNAMIEITKHATKSRNLRAITGMGIMGAGLGAICFGGVITLSAYVKLPEDDRNALPYNEA